MCRKYKLWGYLLAACGIGFLVSGFIGIVFLRIMIGLSLLLFGILLLSKNR